MEETSESRQAINKIRIIFLFGHCPKHLGQSRHAGQCLIFYHALGKDILGPDVGLSAQDVTAGIGWQMKGKWCKGVPGNPINLGGDFDGWKRGRTFVRVPAGADGAGITMGVRQKEGEKAWFDNVRVYKIKEADSVNRREG